MGETGPKSTVKALGRAGLFCFDVGRKSLRPAEALKTVGRETAPSKKRQDRKGLVGPIGMLIRQRKRGGCRAQPSGARRRRHKGALEEEGTDKHRSMARDSFG